VSAIKAGLPAVASAKAGYADGGYVAGGSGATGSQRPVQIVLVDDRDVARKLERDPRFESKIVGIGRRNRAEIVW